MSAGLVITVMLVPQSMAYALLAGLPPIYGLYASTVPAIIYALFGTSKHMPVGPPALMALLTFTSVSAIAKPGSEEYIGYVLLLALMVGVLQLALGLLRMGFLTNFISHPVLSGFIYASAVIIALSQVKHFLGIEPADDHSTLGMVVSITGKIENTNLAPLAIGLLSIATILLLGRFVPRLPGPLVAVVAATLAVYLLSLDGRGVGIVGEVPSAPFLKGGTQKCASDASAVWVVVPIPMLWPSGLAAGWRLSLPGLFRSCRRSLVRPKPAF